MHPVHPDIPMCIGLLWKPNHSEGCTQRCAHEEKKPQPLHYKQMQTVEIIQKNFSWRGFPVLFLGRCRSFSVKKKKKFKNPQLKRQTCEQEQAKAWRD